MKGRSTVKAVANIVSDIVEGLNEGLDSQITLCDLSKAFDCVNHNILLGKLSKYGVRGKPLELLVSYLTNRTQCVIVNSEQSTFLKIKHGVPQGSILGPFLFTEYINDLPDALAPSISTLFADDTSVLNRGHNHEDLLQKSRCAIEKATLWFTTNMLKLNTDKTQYLLVSSNLRKRKGDWVILFGIRIDDELTWYQNEH